MKKDKNKEEGLLPKGWNRRKYFEETTRTRDN